MRRFTALLLVLALLTAPLSASAEGGYPDVDESHWAYSVIQSAKEYGLMGGYDDGRFGLGDELKRREFVTMLCRMFQWEMISPETASYIDCAPDDWFYPAVETARANGALDASVSFRPDDAISREEMSIMLVRALGYDQLAQAGYEIDLPFPDVTENKPYIALAWQIGMTNGSLEDGQLLFKPHASAKREEAAAMLVRVYERYTAKIDWLHGFYAFSSYSQIALTASMDGVSLGWARLETGEDGTPRINTSAQNGNDWAIPKQPEAALDYFAEHDIPYNLNIYSTDADILATEFSRAQAAQAVVALAKDYAGITMDFESLRVEDKENFTAFMTTLRSALPEDKPLYVCVQPIVPDDVYFDGYDFRALGELCDKVILMAHDYQYTSVPASYIGTARTNSPLTPFNKIYYALAAITDPEAGVADRSKIALQICFGSVGWKVNQEDKLISTSSIHPSPSTIVTRLRQEDTLFGWSDTYRNPYIYYTTEDGSRYRLWYENECSVMDKIELAQMFGINGVSLWRLGTVPGYDDAGLEYNVWSALLGDR